MVRRKEVAMRTITAAALLLLSGCFNAPFEALHLVTMGVEAIGLASDAAKSPGSRPVEEEEVTRK